MLRILAGDIGGTKTLLSLFAKEGRGLRMIREATYASADYEDLDSILIDFLEAEPKKSLQVACFGVAGPVINGESKITNLPWKIREKDLSKVLGIRRIKLLNDLMAAAYGMLFLQPKDFLAIHGGKRPRPKGNMAVIAAGTGLGEAMLYWDGNRYHPTATEGGHADFAPQSDQEIDLFKHIRRKLGGHVSYERILSGPGIFEIYGFLRDSGKDSEPPWLTQRLRESEDPSAVISGVGVAGEDPVCVEAINLFSSVYGAEAGNLALKCVAVGGVFLGGGIAPNILAVLHNGSFMRGFTDKGRFSELMTSIKVSVAINTKAPLLGAAHYALSL